MSLLTPTLRGPAPCKVKTASVRIRETYVRKFFGEDGVRRFRIGASPELSRLLTMPDDESSWTDFRLFVESTVLVDRTFGLGNLDYAWKVGRFAATQGGGIWQRLFQKMLSVQTFMEIAGAVWRQHYDSGKLLTTPVSARSLRMEVLDFAMPHRAHCLSVGGWIEASIEQRQSEKTVVVREERCRTFGAASCVFSVYWG